MSDLVAGGILPTDVWHIDTHDGTCSRCRASIPQDQVPLLLWDGDDTNRMLAFCRRCTNFDHGEVELAAETEE